VPSTGVVRSEPHHRCCEKALLLERFMYIDVHDKLPDANEIARNR